MQNLKINKIDNREGNLKRRIIPLGKKINNGAISKRNKKKFFISFCEIKISFRKNLLKA